MLFLWVIFSSIAYNIQDLSAVFTKHNIDIVGATTSGEFIDDEIYEKSMEALEEYVPKE